MNDDAPYNVLHNYRGTLLLLDVFPIVWAGCGCGFETSKWPADLEYEVDAEMRCHLADEHGEVIDLGRCQVCRQPTDYFHARSALEDLNSWLCELHAPKIPVVVDQADTAEGDER